MMADIFSQIPGEPVGPVGTQPVEIDFRAGRLKMTVDGVPFPGKLVQKLVVELDAETCLPLISVAFVASSLTCRIDSAKFVNDSAKDAELLTPEIGWFCYICGASFPPDFNPDPDFPCVGGLVRATRANCERHRVRVADAPWYIAATKLD